MGHNQYREPGQRWDAAPGPAALWELVHDNFPEARNLALDRLQRDGAPPSARARHSLDIGLNEADPSQKSLGDQLFLLFCEQAVPLRLEAVHWAGQAWSAEQPFVRPAEEAEGTRGCLHVAFSPSGSQASDVPTAVAFRVAMLRTGLEELGRANRGLA